MRNVVGNPAAIRVLPARAAAHRPGGGRGVGISRPIRRGPVAVSRAHACSEKQWGGQHRTPPTSVDDHAPPGITPMSLPRGVTPPRATGRPPGSRSSAPANPAVLIRPPLEPSAGASPSPRPRPPVRQRSPLYVNPMTYNPGGPGGPPPGDPPADRERMGAALLYGSGESGVSGYPTPHAHDAQRLDATPYPSNAHRPTPGPPTAPLTCRAIRHASPSPIPASYGFQRSPAPRGSPAAVCGSQQWGAAPPHDPRAAPAGRPRGPSPERGGWVAALRVTHPPAEAAYGGRRRPGAGRAAYPCVPSAYPSAYPLFLPSDLVFLL